MLTPDQKALIRAEEEFREQVRAELATIRPAPSWRKRLLNFLNMPVGGWFLGTVLVAAFSFGWTMAYERLHKRERELAEMRANAQRDAEYVTKLLPHLARVGTPENPLALKVISHLQGAGGIDRTLADALESVIKNALDQGVRGAASAGDAERRASYQASAEAAVAALDAHRPAGQASRLPRRIYVHIADESQRATAQQIQGHLREQKFLMPGVENVGEKPSPAVAEVRYFNDADGESAALVVAELEKLGIKAAAKRVALKAPMGQLELWLARAG
jgi:predicted outer membrane lipoprotein